jgi:hypothetical protein
VNIWKSTLGALCGLIVCAASADAHAMFERVYDSYDDTYVRTEVPHRHRADGSIVVLRNTATYDPYYRPYSAYREYRPDPYYYERNGYYPYYRDNNLGRQLLGSALGYAIQRM